MFFLLENVGTDQLCLGMKEDWLPWKQKRADKPASQKPCGSILFFVVTIYIKVYFFRCHPVSIYYTHKLHQRTPETKLDGGHIPNLHSSSLSDEGLKPQRHRLNWFHIYVHTHIRTHARIQSNTCLQANSTWPRLWNFLPLLVSFIYPLRGKWLESHWRVCRALLFFPTVHSHRGSTGRKSIHFSFLFFCAVLCLSVGNFVRWKTELTAITLSQFSHSVTTNVIYLNLVVRSDDTFPSFPKQITMSMTEASPSKMNLINVYVWKGG